MANTRRRDGSKTDPILLTLLFGLMAFGLLAKMQATKATSFAEVSLWDLSTPMGMQFVWTLISVVVVLLLLVVDSSFWSVIGYPLYGVACLMLVLVLVVGKEVNGAKSWIDLGPIVFQPSELAKFGTALALSNLVANPKSSFKNSKTLYLALGLLAVPIFLILLQSDAGSAMVFLAFGFMLYREGMPTWPIYVILFCAAVLFLTLLFGVLSAMIIFVLACIFTFIVSFRQRHFWIAGWAMLCVVNYFFVREGYGLWVLLADAFFFLLLCINLFQKGQIRSLVVYGMVSTIAAVLSVATDYTFYNIFKPHWRNRLNAWLHPDKCDWDTIYNVVLSKMAISSGGLAGKGFLQGDLTKLDYVPEHTTDFIYCVVGEEYGFIGGAIVLMMFFGFISYTIHLAEQQKQKFNRAYFYSVAAIIFFHVLVNIGMTLGLMPVIGIPLPFFSYGGTSLFIFSILIGVLIRIDSRKLA